MKTVNWAFSLVLVVPLAHAVPKKTVNEHPEKTVKKETIANNWGFTPARDLSEETVRSKKMAKADVPSKDRKPAKALSSGFKGFTPVREDLAHDDVATAKKPAKPKTEANVRRK